MPLLPRLPHAAWLYCATFGRFGPRTMLLLGAGVGVLAGLSVLGDVAGGSVAIGVIVLSAAVPNAVARLTIMDQQGQFDLLRLSGESDRALLGAVLAGMVAPIAALALAFFAVGVPFDVRAGLDVSRPIAASALLFAGTLALAGMTWSHRSRGGRFALETVLALAIISAALVAGFALASARRAARGSVDPRGPLDWPGGVGTWLLAGAIEVGIVALCVPGVMRWLRRSGTREGRVRPLRLVPQIPARLWPDAARGLLVAQASALVWLLMPLVAVAAIGARGRGFIRPQDLTVMLSAVVYAPLAGALAFTVYQCRLDAESGRLDAHRLTPRPALAAAWRTITGLCLPFVLASVAAAAWAFTIVGATPAFPHVALLAFVTLVPAAAVEGWLVRHKTPLLGAASALPVVIVLITAVEVSPTRAVLAWMATGWIAWAVAAAALRNPAAVTLSAPLGVAAVTMSAAAAFDFLFTGAPSMHVAAGFLAGGLLFAAPLLANGDRVQRTLPIAGVLLAGAAMVAVRSYPPWRGLAVVCIPAIALAIGMRVHRAWPRERSFAIRAGLVYAPFIPLTALSLALANPFAGVRLRDVPIYDALQEVLEMATVVAMLLAAAGVEMAAAIRARRARSGRQEEVAADRAAG